MISLGQVFADNVRIDGEIATVAVHMQVDNKQVGDDVRVRITGGNAELVREIGAIGPGLVDALEAVGDHDAETILGAIEKAACTAALEQPAGQTARSGIEI